MEGAFGAKVDYAQLIKIYSNRPNENDASHNGNLRDDTDFIRKLRVSGKPNEDLVSMSYVERQNLTMRMAIRRFTRRTNGFSKMAENHAHALALYTMYYNFCRIHESLQVTPAMEAGVTDRLWTLNDIVGLIEEAEANEDESDSALLKFDESQYEYLYLEIDDIDDDGDSDVDEGEVCAFQRTEPEPEEGVTILRRLFREANRRRKRHRLRRVRRHGGISRPPPVKLGHSAALRSN